MKIYLETDRVRLRELTAKDRSALIELDSDPEVMKFLTGGRPSTLRQVQKMIGRVAAELKRSEHKFGVWAAVEKKTGDFMGWFHLFPLHDDPKDINRLYLGYRLKKIFWGQGYATEVSRRLIEKSFLEFGAREVCAQAMKANLKSQNVMIKAGLTLKSEYREKTFPKDQQVAVLFSVEKADWPKQVHSS